VFSRYESRLAAMDAELQAELDPFRSRIETLRQAVENLKETFALALPDRPDPEVEEPDESGWLFDTERDYLTQLGYYQARKTVITDESHD
jgi:hypothetical protein